MTKLFHFLLLIIGAWLCLAGCSEDDTKKEEDIITEPEELLWSFFGKQKGIDFQHNLYFKLFCFGNSIYSSITFGTDSAEVAMGINVMNNYYFDQIETYWDKKEDHIYLLSRKDNSLVLEGHIQDTDKIEVWWENGLGEDWKAKAAECGWISKMTLYLFEPPYDISLLWLTPPK